MKAAAFTVARPGDLREAARLLGEDARAIAGGQSLGPMLNLRAARPAVLVPLDRLAALQGAEDGADAITLGAAVTHAAIADGRTPDLPGRVLGRVAEGIAYRAVRNRGTIGGSLCHADPAADWLTTLTALGAAVLTTTRTVALAGFVVGPFQTVLAPGEVVVAVRVPRPAPGFRWGYAKLCRKPGAFAHAMAAYCRDATAVRLAVGAQGGPPLLLQGERATAEAADAALAGTGAGAVERHLHGAAVRRAMAEAEV